WCEASSDTGHWADADPRRTVDSCSPWVPGGLGRGRGGGGAVDGGAVGGRGRGGVDPAAGGRSGRVRPDGRGDQDRGGGGDHAAAGDRAPDRALVRRRRRVAR